MNRRLAARRQSREIQAAEWRQVTLEDFQIGPPAKTRSAGGKGPLLDLESGFLESKSRLPGAHSQC